jgi:hypothetical protein
MHSSRLLGGEGSAVLKPLAKLLPRQPNEIAVVPDWQTRLEG